MNDLTRFLPTKAVIKVRMDSPALEAFRLMCTHGISAIPVVDSQNRIVAEISTLDLGFVHSDNFSCLLTDVQSFCRVDKTLSSPVTCTINATLSNVLEKMYRNKRTHIWVRNATQPLLLY